MRVLALSSALLLAASVAQAQGYGQPSGPAYGQAPSAGYGGYDNRSAASSGYGAPPSDPGEPDLARELNLRPDQRAAHRDYQAAFNASHEGQEGDPRADVQRLATMTTPQRLDDAARQMERERSAFDQVAAATRRFYASLDGAQRRTFDRLTAPSLDEAPDGPGDDGYASPGRPPQVQPRR